MQRAEYVWLQTWYAETGVLFLMCWSTARFFQMLTVQDLVQNGAGSSNVFHWPECYVNMFVGLQKHIEC